MQLRTLFAVTAVAFVCGCATVAPAPSTSSRVDLGQRDSVFPVEVLNPDVRQETVQVTICVPGYTASVRPSTSYTTGVKLKLLKELGLLPTAATQYELDHKVPLALGGHPRNLRNLELQSWEGDDGARKKDRLERSLQRLVCAGKVLLREAQQAMYFDWKSAATLYRPIP